MKNGFYFCCFLIMLSGILAAQTPKPVSATSDWVSVQKKPPAAPLITWRNPFARRSTETKPVMRVTICVVSTEPLTQLQFVHNDKTINGLTRGFKRVECGMEYSEDIPLQAGLNEIYVTATSAAGTTTSEPRQLSYQLEKEEMALKAGMPRRLALVIANGRYARYPLRNPTNDGRAVKRQLEKLGFVVTYRENLSLRSVKAVLDTFLTELGNRNTGLFYYAGHGLMINGENYLQPVDADPSTETDVEYECYPLRRLVARMATTNPNGSNVVFWDACRNNPYRSWNRGPGESVFASAQPAVGTLVIYATEPGKVAYDGNEEHGLFTSELVKHIDQPNIDIFELVDRIDRGLEERGFRQPPFLEGRLRGKFYFKMP